MALLRIQNLTTTFHAEEGLIKACDRVNLNIPAGETIGLIGETGCGKSVLGMSILRLLPRNAVIEGEIRYKGEDILTMDADRLRRLRGKEIALLPQSPATSLNPVLKIGFQISEGLRLHQKTTREQARARAAEMLGFLKMAEPARRMKEYPHQLSGGMKQRALAAASITGKPNLLIADEPTKGLDAILRAQVVGVLRQLVQKTGAAMLLITHDLKVAAALCDRIAVMYAGEILEYGPAGQVLGDPRHPYTQGLLASLPAYGLHPIPGNSPGLLEEPAGCKFYRRCARAAALARELAAGELSSALSGELSASKPAPNTPANNPANSPADTSANNSANNPANNSANMPADNPANNPCATRHPSLQPTDNGSYVRCLCLDQCGKPEQNLFDRDFQKAAV